VQRGAGLKIAVPVQGVPLGLGLLGTDQAMGTITIRDAFTYALPPEGLLRNLRSWASDPPVKTVLKVMYDSVERRRGQRHPLFLRVVTRVYLVGGVDVSLTSSAASSGGVDLGQAPAVELPKLRPAAGAGGTTTGAVDTWVEEMAAYRAYLDALSAPLNRPPAGGQGDAPPATQPAVAAEQAVGADAMATAIASATAKLVPGAAVRVASASRHAVGIQEDFGRLLAIGYLGFDVEILDGGELGPPVSTYYQIRDDELPALKASVALPELETDRPVLEVLHELQRQRSAIKTRLRSPQNVEERKRLADADAAFDDAARGAGFKDWRSLVARDSQLSAQDVDRLRQQIRQRLQDLGVLTDLTTGGPR
jgi:hypothetical protein